MNIEKRKKIALTLMISFGVLSIISAITSIVFALENSIYSYYFLVITMLVLVVDRILLILFKDRKLRLKDFILTNIYIVLAVLIGFTKYSIYFLSSSFFVFCLTFIFDCILDIIIENTFQSRIRNSLKIVFLFTYSFIFFFPAIYLKHATSVSNSNFIVLSYSVGVLIACLAHFFARVYRKHKLHYVVPILRKTLTAEILLGLFNLILFCSIYFVIKEPSITSFTDALWYCFSVITTIGFGDVTVSTTFGRILSVILGIYGIAMVALFTSLIVNFYNERNKKRDAYMLKEIKQTADELKKEEESIKKDIENK